mmetsp:Transcript_27030/g.74539  ORF Transcript_27030/g.74539 Transcript_27030/m.74539 type:complete len:339 (-) Transcript_27030:70-1086(-)
MVVVLYVCMCVGMYVYVQHCIVAKQVKSTTCPHHIIILSVVLNDHSQPRDHRPGHHHHHHHPPTSDQTTTPRHRSGRCCRRGMQRIPSATLIQSTLSTQLSLVGTRSQTKQIAIVNAGGHSPPLIFNLRHEIPTHGLTRHLILTNAHSHRLLFHFLFVLHGVPQSAAQDAQFAGAAGLGQVFAQRRPTIVAIVVRAIKAGNAQLNRFDKNEGLILRTGRFAKESGQRISFQIVHGPARGVGLVAQQIDQEFDIAALAVGSGEDWFESFERDGFYLNIVIVEAGFARPIVGNQSARVQFAVHFAVLGVVFRPEGASVARFGHDFFRGAHWCCCQQQGCC